MESKNTFFETKEGKATIKFAAWMIFIVILIIVFAINGYCYKNSMFCITEML